MANSILQNIPLGFPWQTLDPFLFCVHHLDLYPNGNEHMGPDAELTGRNIGNDFQIKDGWRMYHGDVVPGFPQHPHRGFETITIARQGFIDHSDSLGATARFGNGDVQWMTAGKGIVHSEMFPLVNRDAGNPCELFQIWLNLPAQNKMADPYFSMYWAEGIPVEVLTDPAGRETEVTVFAGQYGSAAGVKPPPDSWAARSEAAVTIFTIKMDAEAEWTLPATMPGSNRVMYYFTDGSVTVDGELVNEPRGLHLVAEHDVKIKAGRKPVEFLLLGGRPIGEPVAQYGPFVMNTAQEIQQAFADYQSTQFGGWPWSSHGPVHDREKGRFAIHADGKMEEPRTAVG